GAINSTLVDTLADVTDPGRRDLVLNIAVVPGEALTPPRRKEGAGGLGRAGRRGKLPRDVASSEEEPVRVSERREGRRAERIGCDHVQRLHLGMVRKGDHDVVLD